MKQQISIKTEEEIRTLKEGGKRLRKILQDLATMVKPGISTFDLEIKADNLILAAGGYPAFKHYHTNGEEPYPSILCTSINDEVVHAPAVPGRILKEGDIIGIDIGMRYPAENGFYTDTAVTVSVGRITKEAAKLVEVTRNALFVGIKAVKAGRPISDIGQAVEQYVSQFNYGIVRDLVGHGVGYAVHEEPRVPNYFDRALSNVIMKGGLVIAIEPMINAGTWKVVEGSDGFTIKTADGSLSAHFEHTIAVTKKGADIIT